MNKLIFIMLLLLINARGVEAQIQLSPVNCGDCVADRILAKRTAYVDELSKKYCTENNREKQKIKQCIENSKADSMFPFFTDKCSESDYFLGINGKEVRLRKTSKAVRKQHYFIGSYAGEGVRLKIEKARLIEKTYEPAESRNEADVVNASYKVDVTVTNGKFAKTIKNVILSSGY